MTSKSHFISGPMISLAPQEKGELLSWQCGEHYAAEITEYKIGVEDDYITLPDPELEVHLSFELITRPGDVVTHINPPPFKTQKFSKTAILEVVNKTDKELLVWGTLAGSNFPITTINPEITEEVAMSFSGKTFIDNQLENSQIGMKKLAPTALGVVADPQNLPSYDEGDAAALLTDKNGRLLVSIDALTEEAEDQLNRLSTTEVELHERLLEAQVEAERQRTESQLLILREQNKHERKQAKTNVKLTKVNNEHDAVVSKNQSYVDTSISVSRYDFFGTFVRWTIVAATTLSLAYLYLLT